MKATVKIPFAGRADDSTRTTNFKINDIIEGELARAMVEAGYATEGEGKTPEKKPTKNKAKTPPKNKSGA